MYAVSFDFHSKCASVAARYELKEVFDNLIITLCKFTTLLNTHEVSEVQLLCVCVTKKLYRTKSQYACDCVTYLYP